jgi:hypothetical protein
MSCHVKLRKFLLSFPIPAKYHYLMHIDSKLYALIIRDSPMARCFTSWRTTRERWWELSSKWRVRLMPFIAVFDLVKAS